MSATLTRSAIVDHAVRRAREVLAARTASDRLLDDALTAMDRALSPPAEPPHSMYQLSVLLHVLDGAGSVSEVTERLCEVQDAAWDEGDRGHSRALGRLLRTVERCQRAERRAA